MNESDYVGYQDMEPESYLAPSRSKVTFRCPRCQGTFSRVYKAVPKDNPPCPKLKCKRIALEEEFALKERNLRRMIEEGKPPGHIGENITVKAVDATAEIVMQDYGLTNLKDNIREGESVAPPLPPEQQKKADGYFNGGALKSRGLNKKQVELLGRRAIAGQFRSSAINPDILTKGNKGDPALRLVRKESLQ